MRRTLRVGIVATMALAIGTSGWVALAQHAGHAGHEGSGGYGDARAHTGRIRGRIVRVEETAITVETESRDGIASFVFLVDGHTGIKGEPMAGSEVSVRYREEYGSMTAIKIVVKKPK